MLNLTDPLLGINPVVGNDIPFYLNDERIPFATANFVEHENGHLFLQHFRDEYFEGYLYQASFKKDTRLALSAKPNGTIWFMVQKGQISWINDPIKRVIPENHCCFQPADHPYHHLEIPTGQHDIWAIELSSTFLAHMSSELSGCFEKLVLLDVSQQNGMSNLLNIPNTFRRRIDLLYMISRTTDEIQRMALLTTDQPAYIQEIKQYIESHYYNPIDSVTLARQFRLNPYVMKRCFKKAYGTSISTHLRNVRVNNGKKLLLETDTPIASIAFQVGYESAAGFSRIFGELVGCTPISYRQQFRQKKDITSNNIHDDSPIA